VCIRGGCRDVIFTWSNIYIYECVNALITTRGLKVVVHINFSYLHLKSNLKVWGGGGMLELC
jgi:hypothetical protein